MHIHSFLPAELNDVKRSGIIRNVGQDRSTKTGTVSHAFKLFSESAVLSNTKTNQDIVNVLGRDGIGRIQPSTDTQDLLGC